VRGGVLTIAPYQEPFAGRHLVIGGIIEDAGGLCTLRFTRN